MGCGSSSAGGNNATQDKDFRQYLATGNPLAIAMEKNWVEFMDECKMKCNGAAVQSNRSVKVVVIKSADEAVAQKLTFEVASHVVDSFLGHAMTSLTRRQWGGAVRHTLSGVRGQESRLAISGSVTFPTATDDTTKVTVPYNVTYSLFFCE